MSSGARHCLQASAEEATSSCSCLCSVAARNDVVERNGLGQGTCLVSNLMPIPHQVPERKGLNRNALLG